MMERHEDHPTAPLRKRESSVAKCARGAQRAARIVRGQDCRERIVLVQRAAAGKPAARFRTLLTGWLQVLSATSPAPAFEFVEK